MSSTVPQLRARLPRMAESAVERARLTLVPARRTKAPRVPFVTLVSVILLGGVVGLLLFNTSMQQASFTATALEEQATTLSAREQSLQMELERLRDPQRVAQAAKRQGLVIPSAPAFLDLDTGEVTGNVAPATAQTDTPIMPPPPTRPAALDPEPIRLTARDTRDTTRHTTRHNARNNTRQGHGVGARGDGERTPRLGGQRDDHRENHRRR